MTESSDATPVRAELRHCTYCLQPGADCCVGETPEPTGPASPVYAHRRCALREGVKPLYVCVTPSAAFPWA